MLAVSGVLISAVPSAALAHPHGWIDLSVEVMTDADGNATALHQTWRMDPFYSLVVLEELSQGEEANLDEGLDHLAHEIRDNLAAQHYFTEVRLNGERQALGEVTNYTALARNGRLHFMFRLPLAKPQPLKESELTYQVFDPTYYLEVVHEAEDNTVLDEALTLRGEYDCTLNVEPADPDPELIMRATMLDKDEQGEPGLGRHFAETGVVACR
ncbi:DUF1007 family protein [Halomonas vilamensis]|uniref:DUF1007 family protein n=2 Tax=Vreelandella vilamensis TaxID=531309 RepID=A0ABU1H180_9GAMM|nr:DUF1007 family protein [Halomonas vilamensis]MDR5897417.1 DUF1007 family protein [Halomonas vilamensis]